MEKVYKRRRPEHETRLAERFLGVRFGRLTVAERAANVNGRHYWVCRCDCGSDVTVRGDCLGPHNTLSCGCLNRSLTGQRAKALNTTHGLSDSREYAIWHGMHYRCSSGADNYGGRGITVCERWSSFEAFYSDMGQAPSAQHSIDRIDVNGHYEPSNCRWATTDVQANNRRDTVVLSVCGTSLPLAEWARRLGIDRVLLWIRLFRLKWSVVEALATPARAPRFRHGNKAL